MKEHAASAGLKSCRGSKLLIVFIVRYLSMFRAANGVYPTGFHTGADDKNASQTLRLADGNGTALTTCAEYNFGTASTVTPLTTDMIASLEGAGIVSLASGRTVAEKISTATRWLWKIF